MNSLATTFPFKDPAPIISGAVVALDGKAVSVTFDVVDNITHNGDRAIFVFHFNAPWLHSSSPLLCSTEYYRKAPSYFPKVCPKSRAMHVNVVKNGLTIRFESKPEGLGTFVFEDTYPACFLFAYAPFTGNLKSSSPAEVAQVLQRLNSSPNASRIAKTPDLSLISRCAAESQKPWSRYPKGHPKNLMNHDQIKTIPTYDAELVRNDIDMQHKLFQDLVGHSGIAAIINMPPSKDYEEDNVQKILYEWFFDVFGKPNQHHSRFNQVWHICQKFDDTSQDFVAVDYDLTTKLNMHNDGVNYIASGSYLQANYQTVGDVTARVIDGFAAADYLKTHYPEYYVTLSTVPVVHGMRHQLYTKSGVHSTVKEAQQELRVAGDDEEFHEVELINSRPIIEVQKGFREVRDEKGDLQIEETEITTQVNYCPMKIGVNTMDTQMFEKFMKANAKWYDIMEGEEPGIGGAYFDGIEFPQDSMILFNNQRMLHGRATVINPGLQKHVRRNINGDIDEQGRKLDRDLSQVLDTDGLDEKPSAKNIRRQMVGTYQNRGYSEARFRLLTMKILENQLSDDLDMEVYSEFDDAKRNGEMQPGRDVLASWLPRCPTKVLDRMIVH